MNYYEREQALFALLVEAIERENPNPDEGIERLLSVLRAHICNLRRLVTGQHPDLSDYREMLVAAATANDLLESLLENHPGDIACETSQAGRMFSILAEVRHEIETSCWNIEDQLPELKVGFDRIRESMSQAVN